MKRRPRLQIKPNIGLKAVSQIENSNNDSENHHTNIKALNLNSVDGSSPINQQLNPSERNSTVFPVASHVEPFELFENENQLKKNDSTLNGADQNKAPELLEKTLKSHDSSGQEGKVKKRARIPVKPKLTQTSISKNTDAKTNQSSLSSSLPDSSLPTKGPFSPSSLHTSSTINPLGLRVVTSTTTDTNHLITNTTQASLPDAYLHSAFTTATTTLQYNTIKYNTTTDSASIDERREGGVDDGGADGALNLHEFIASDDHPSPQHITNNIINNTLNNYSVTSNRDHVNTVPNPSNDTSNNSDNDNDINNNPNDNNNSAVENYFNNSTNDTQKVSITSTNSFFPTQLNHPAKKNHEDWREREMEKEEENENDKKEEEKEKKLVEEKKEKKKEDKKNKEEKKEKEGEKKVLLNSASMLSLPLQAKEPSVVRSVSSQHLNERLINRKNKERQKSRLTQPLLEPVDTSVVCMKDLIYKNPVNNPMKYRLLERKGKKKGRSKDGNDDNISDTSSVLSGSTNNSISTNKSNKNNSNSSNNNNNSTVSNNNKNINDDVDENIAVPQIEIGADGKIVINEKSLEVAEESDGEMEVVNETDVCTSGYPKKNRTKTWGINETKKFYAALSMIGTDFSLMTQVFANRSRQDLKRKFKREDKLNTFLVDAALKERRALDITLLAEPVSEDPPNKNKNKKANKNKSGLEAAEKDGEEEDEEEEEEAETGEKRKRSIKDGRSKKKFNFYENSDDDEEEEEDEEYKVGTNSKDDFSEVASVTTNDDDDIGDVKIVEIIRRRKTRCGRVVKAPLAFERVSSAIAGSSLVKDTPIKRSESKLSQQLQQMEADRRQKVIKGVLENIDKASVDDNESLMDSNFDAASVADSVVVENNVVLKEDGEAPVEAIGGLIHDFERLHSNLNVVDHNNIDLSALGIDHIPPQHRLVIVSQKKADDGHAGSSEEMEMHVFVVSDATLTSVLQTTNQSNRDPVEILFSLIQPPDKKTNTP